MNRFSINIFANLLGQSWSVIVSIAVIPLYIKFLGIEAYGLLGFYMMLQGALQVLDLGLSPTMNRELARYSTMPEKAGEARDLVRTLEVGYWLLGMVIGAAVAGAAPFFTHHWLNIGALPPEDVQTALMMMGVLVALQWPQSFYGSGLMGLQKQVLANSVGIPMSAISSGGAVLILWLVSPTITALLCWQILASAIHVALVTILLWRSLPSSGRPPRFSVDLLRSVWRFAVGMGGIGLASIIFTQLDKVILSKMLSLEMFGYYILGTTIGRSLNLFITPVFNAVFPRFSALVEKGDVGGLRDLYHRSTQLMAVLVLPMAILVTFFSYDIALLWIGKAEAGVHVAPIAGLLVIGTAINGLMCLPYALQLAYGWTSIGLKITSSFIVIMVPSLIVMTTHYGATGAAFVWVALNSLYLLVGLPLTHRYLLRGEAWRWLRMDVCQPLAVTLAIMGIGKWLLIGQTKEPSLALVVNLSILSLCTLAGAVLAAPMIRSWIMVQFFKAKPIHV